MRRAFARSVLTVTVVALVPLVGPLASAAASSYVRTDFRAEFTTGQPGASTGFAEHILYRDENDPNAKPKTFHKLVVDLPEGTRFDTGVVATCGASDAELMAMGAAACPPESQVGAGTSTSITGFGPPIDPYATELTVFQGNGELLGLIFQQGSDRPLAVEHIKINGASLIDEPAPLPGGPPDWRTALRQVDLALQPRSIDSARAGRAYITTPPTCPEGGAWQARITVSYDDGVTESAFSSIPCSSGGPPFSGGGPPAGGTLSDRLVPAMRLTVSPRRVRARTRARFRFRVQSASPACRQGVTVRFAGRRARTSARGSVTIGRRLRRRGRYRAIATKPGCRQARVSVKVLRSKLLASG